MSHETTLLVYKKERAQQIKREGNAMINELEIELAYARERIETLESEIDSLIEELALVRAKVAGA
jgi:predicted  nucleic acid-binding Zn-ribbon protein